MAGNNRETQLSDFVGMQVRERRRFLGMTIAELSSACKISVSNLSKIETAQVSPSLSSLEAIAQALGVPVSFLFQGFKDEGFLVQIPKGQGLITERQGKDGGHEYELLTNNAGQVQTVQPFLVTLDEVGDHRASFNDQATEFLYLLEGKMQYRYGTRKIDLSEGDALIFDGRTAHGPEKVVEAPVRYLAVLVRKPGDVI
ncbi:helix-turn-helix domain-containing protein [Leisingera sp. S232]|uniref:helix-turn-helix domain-containing protein n=1 Tax=Leisingera sp. S232 TaxID=3415132 RepID=UPI0026C16252